MHRMLYFSGMAWGGPHVGVTTLPLQVMMTLNEFARLCKTSEMQEVVEKLLHATLCMACHFNRLRVVRHLLEVHECDPRCSASKEGHSGCIEGVSNKSGRETEGCSFHVPIMYMKRP